MTTKVDISDLQLKEIVLTALENNKIRLPKDNKLEIQISARLGKDGFSLDSSAVTKMLLPSQAEMLGGDITEEDWNKIFNMEIFQGDLIPKSEPAKMLSGLRQLREESEIAYFDNILRTRINMMFKQYRLPYRVTTVGNRYQRKYLLGKLY